MYSVENINTTKNKPQQSIFKHILSMFLRFFKTEASSGILLIFSALLALVWANSPWGSSYATIWQTELTAGIGSLALTKPLILWINDGLMAIFFFVVGLEIKREVLSGELSTWNKAALPIAAALGGMAVPAVVYLIFNGGSSGAAGWGIPMATDIAFALGILALLGKRVPVSLKVFLTAVAIVDDIGAVLVIALFYTAKISLVSLLIGASIILLLIITNRLNVQSKLVYGLLGVALWVAVLKSGVHATIAGVLVAMMIPARPSDKPSDEAKARSDESHAPQSLLHHLEHALQPWVAYAIMPIFALANAGVNLGGETTTGLANPVSLGIIAGLILGKQVGIMSASWLLIRTNLAAKPDGVTWRHLYGVSWLAGIGFTMSLFIANLAFSEPTLLFTAKIGILGASLLAGVSGWLLLSDISIGKIISKLAAGFNQPTGNRQNEQTEQLLNSSS